VAEQFTGQKGKYVKIADTIKGFKEIVEASTTTCPNTFRMVGTIEEAMEQAERIRAATK